MIISTNLMGAGDCNEHIFDTLMMIYYSVEQEFSEFGKLQ